MLKLPSAPASSGAVIIAAAVVLAVMTGSRTTNGLFIGPIISGTGIGAATVSLAMATAALAWGAAQPLYGAWLARIGAPRLLGIGGVLAAALTALAACATNGAELVVVMTAAGAAGAAAGSPPLLMGIVAQRVSEQRRGFALGVVSAGGSVGQLVAAPAIAFVIAGYGWQAAMLVLAAAGLAVVPLVLVFRAPQATRGADVDAGAPALPVMAALRDRNYWLITAGFFVCGFHVMFLTTHMPGVIELCGFSAGFSGIWLAVVGACNIVASVGAGHLMQRMPMKSLLATLYALRALGVALFLALPSSEAVLLGFALWMGLTYMATLPPTTGLLARLYGPRQLATLFGITMAAHQLGSFLGAWLGGIELELTGGYQLVWLLDIALAVGAALAHLPINERPTAARPQPAYAR
jgi:predicted MFS family arabinose efflux permease